MANYFSSFWSGSRGGWASRFAGFGGRGGCSCTKRCRCPAGAPCRCQTTCTCASRAPGPFSRRAFTIPGGFSDNWLDAGESGELGRRRFAGARYSRPYSRAYSRPYSRPGYGRRSYGGNYRYGPRYGSGTYASSGYARGQGYGSRLGAPYQQRRQVWNSYLSGRYGWNRFAGRIGNFFGCPGCSPGSSRFSNALSQWQRRLGLRPTGVLTPGLWRWLRPRIARPGLPPGAGHVAPQPMPPPPPPPMGSPAADAAPPPGPAPEPDAPPPEEPPPPDTPPDAPPEDAAAPADAAPAADAEYGAGFRRRRYYPGMHRYQGIGYQPQGGQGQYGQGQYPRGYRRRRPWQPNY